MPGQVKQSELEGAYYFIQHYRMASLLDVLIFDAVYGSWILSLPLFTLDCTESAADLCLLYCTVLT